MIWSSPSPLIDVYGIQTLAPNAILEGLNPYSIVYHFPWEKSPLDVYSYGPFNIYLNFIAFFTFHDPRYVQIFSEIGVGLLVYVLLRKHKLKKQNRNIPEMLSLIFLFSPRSLLILEQAWIDPVLLFLIFLFATLLFVWKRPALAFIVLGLAIATKQYAILLLPFLLFGGIMKVKNFLTTVIVVFAASLPFLIWNFKDFIRDVVLFSIFVYPSRYDSLSWNTFVHGITGHDIPKLVILLMELFLFYFLIKKQSKNIGSEVILNTGILLLFTYLVYRIAFIHYYYFAGSLIFLSVVLMLVEKGQLSDHQSKK